MLIPRAVYLSSGGAIGKQFPQLERNPSVISENFKRLIPICLPGLIPYARWLKTVVITALSHQVRKKTAAGDLFCSGTEMRCSFRSLIKLFERKYPPANFSISTLLFQSLTILRISSIENARTNFSFTLPNDWTLDHELVNRLGTFRFDDNCSVMRPARRIE